MRCRVLTSPDCFLSVSLTFPCETNGSFYSCDSCNLSVVDCCELELVNATVTFSAKLLLLFKSVKLTGFTAVTAADVERVILSIPAKSSPLDIVPTSLLKSCSDVFAVVIARLANLSFRDGRFPTCFKLAEVLPLLKKSGANQADPSNFRPISNLSTISKVLERLALGQLRPHLLSSPNFCSHQSGFRTGHSTETALFEMLNDVYTAGDDRRLTVAIGLDISAAFNTISHDVLIDLWRSAMRATQTAWNSLSRLEEATLHPSVFKRLRRLVVVCFCGCSDGGGSVGPVPWFRSL